MPLLQTEKTAIVTYLRLQSIECHNGSSKQLLISLKSQKANDDPESAWTLVQEYLDLKSNHCKQLYMSIQHEINVLAYWIAAKYYKSGEFQNAIQKLEGSSLNTPDYFKLLGQCYKAQGDDQKAYNAFFQGALNDKKQRKEIEQCLLALISSPKNLQFLYDMVTGNKKDYVGTIIGKYTYKGLSKSGAAFSQTGSILVVPFILIACLIGPIIGVSIGIFHAATRKFMSKTEQKGAIDGLQKLVIMEPKEQLDLIRSVIDLYKHSQTKASSKSSEELYEKLINDTLEPTEKIQHIISYMLTRKSNGLFENHGRRLFSIIAKATITPSDLANQSLLQAETSTTPSGESSSSSTVSM